MKILCVGQFEQPDYPIQQVQKQTRQPDYFMYYQDKKPANTITGRRVRIANNHTKLKDIVRDFCSKYEVDAIWQIEQDGELEPDTLEKLEQRYKELYNTSFAYISGIEVGRHGVYCLGAWHVADDRNSFTSVNHKSKGIVRVDATGFYCLLANKDKWLSGKASWKGERYGPDVVWGLSIKGDKYVDMSIKVGHKTQTGIIRPEHISTTTVKFYKVKDQWMFKEIA